MSESIHGMSDASPFAAMKRTVLITGAARRIGRVMALHLAVEGWDIVIHAHRSIRQAESLQKNITSIGRKASIVIGDLRDDPEAIIKKAQSQHDGGIGAVIHNASVFVQDSFENATPASWSEAMDINSKAPFFLSQSFASSLASNERGCIIHITDQRIFNMTPHFASYSISQCALHAMTRGMALAFAPRIRVNGVAPGPILTHEGQSLSLFRDQCRRMPLGHGGQPSSVAEAASFLLKNEAITGVTIAVDGGQSLGWQHKEPPLLDR